MCLLPLWLRVQQNTMFCQPDFSGWWSRLNIPGVSPNTICHLCPSLANISTSTDTRYPVNAWNSQSQGIFNRAPLICLILAARWETGLNCSFPCSKPAYFSWNGTIKREHHQRFLQLRFLSIMLDCCLFIQSPVYIMWVIPWQENTLLLQWLGFWDYLAL